MTKLWLHMMERALRPAPRKNYLVLLDHTKNDTIQEFPTVKRLWTLERAKNLNGDRRLNGIKEGS